MIRTVIIDKGLGIEQVVAVARFGAKVRLSERAKDRIARSRALIDNIVEGGEAVYGVNTGFGKFSDVAISRGDAVRLQENLIMSHACGVGEPFCKEIVRGMMLLRVNALSVGYSGVKLDTVELLVELLNKDVIPYVPSKGSLGASGDLAPLSHVALCLIGKGRCYYRNKLMDTEEAFAKCGLSKVTLGEKEGLALINGTQAMNAIAVLAVYDSRYLMEISTKVAGLTIEALGGIIDAYDDRVHQIRLQKGQIEIARQLRENLRGSANIRKQGDERVQDAYTLRCIPQVHGASYDAISYIEGIVSNEINAVTDNPVIIPTGEAISGGNFHGQYLSMAMDYLAIAVAELANISERRTERMVNPQLNYGLPAFLVEKGGLNNGFMIPQYVAAALVSENKVLCHPAVVDSITSSANQEDHVSMGMTAARKAREVIKNVQNVLGIELMTACQAIELAKKQDKLSDINAKSWHTVRKFVPYVAEDVYLAPLIEKCEQIITEQLL
ncbi:MAG: histidine ammonia-lyase [Clostridia bacterium]|nr:histidine ammonia-lyase [Clostridia bacterium]